MKKLFVILVLFAVACDVNKEDPEPVYTDIYGWWTFDHDRVSGTFNIVKGPDGKPYVDNVGGFFTIDKGPQVTVEQKYLVSMDGFDIDQIVLKDSKVPTTTIEFYYSGEMASDYKTMSFTSVYFSMSGKSEIIDFDKPLTVSRTKD